VETVPGRARAAPLLLVLVLCGCGESPQLPRMGADAVILAFGDSLTHGTGASEAQSYPAILARLSGREVINAGVPGEISADGLERLPGLLDEHQPDLLVLCHGGNDFLRRLDTGATADHLRRMIRLAHERGAGVLLVGVPQFGLFLNAAPLYAEVADETGVPHLDWIIPEVLGDASLKSDTVHPNAAGYRRIAEAVHQSLVEAGAF
jgi:lysophospholipase L1-like esterase